MLTENMNLVGLLALPEPSSALHTSSFVPPSGTNSQLVASLCNIYHLLIQTSPLYDVTLGISRIGLRGFSDLPRNSCPNLTFIKIHRGARVRLEGKTRVVRSVTHAGEE